LSQHSPFSSSGSFFYFRSSNLNALTTLLLIKTTQLNPKCALDFQLRLHP
jgi:hypothetical protein